MTFDGLDPVIHAPKRLAAMAVLAHSSSAQFGFLRDRLQVSDSDLSKQMSALAQAGYVKVSKTGRGRGSVTWYQITKAGVAAFERHVAALRALAQDAAGGAGASGGAGGEPGNGPGDSQGTPSGTARGTEGTDGGATP